MEATRHSLWSFCGQAEKEQLPEKIRPLMHLSSTKPGQFCCC